MSGSVEHYVDWTKVDPARISIGSPETKTPKAGPDGKQGAPYATANLYYLYELPNGGEVKDTLAIQLCEVKVYGLQLPKNGFKDTQIKAIFAKDKPEVELCMKKMDQVHARLVDLVCQPGIKGNLKAEKVMPEFAKLKGVGINKLIAYPTDKLTSEPDMTKNPSVYYKLISYESNKSKFSILDDKGEIKILEWSEIENADFSGKPVINYKGFYSNGNGNVSPQSPVTSFAIFDIKYKGSGNPQADELRKQAEKNPEMIKNVTAGYKELIEKMAASKYVHTSDTKTELQSAGSNKSPQQQTPQQNNTSQQTPQQNNTSQQTPQHNTSQQTPQQHNTSQQTPQQHNTSQQTPQQHNTSQQAPNLQNFMKGPSPTQQFYGNINPEQSQQTFNMPPGFQGGIQLPPGFNMNSQPAAGSN